MAVKFIRSKDFKNFDWSILKEGEFSTNGENFNFGKGGPSYPGGDGWHISIYGENGKEEVWELPTAISRFIDYIKKQGEDNKLDEVRRVLGIK